MKMWGIFDAYLYRPGMLQTIHGYDERVAIEEVVRAVEVYAEMAIDYLR